MEFKIKILLYLLPFHDCSFSGNGFYHNLNSPNKNLSKNDWDVFKKRGVHFIHININTILPKIDEECYNTN